MTTQLQYGIAGDRPYSLYYRHSGRTPIGSVLLAAIAGSAVAVVAAGVYAYIDLYIPIIYANVLATAGFGALIGFVTAGVLKWGRVRSVPVGLALVLVITLVGYYFSWVFWIKAAFDRYADPAKFGAVVTLPHLVTSPRLLWACATLLNETGTWSFGSGAKENVSGAFLGLIWLVEAGAIFFLSITVARSRIGEEIFCERCGQWCGRALSLGKTAPGDAALARQAAESHDFRYFATLGQANPAHFWELQCDRCLSCNGLHTLTLRDFTLKTDSKGNQSLKDRVLVNRLIISADEAKAILESRQAPPPPAARPIEVITPDALATDAPPPPPAPTNA
jgi:hypothetical protein